MTHFWDKRYSSESFVYGKKPNAYFSSHLGKMTPGALLLPGEGEGRNAVYAAEKGWVVDAFDQSNAGREKALMLAKEMNVLINYDVCEAEAYSFKPNHYDFAALIYVHTDEPGRKNLHRLVYESLKPGGNLIVEAFHKEQLNYNTGGPKSEVLLYDEETLSEDFRVLEILKLEKQKILLNEGPLHQGEALVIRLTGIKPK